MAHYNLKFELRKDRPDRQGKCYIRIRVLINHKRSKYVSTDIKILPEHWNSEIQKVNHQCPNASHLNFKLAKIKLDYEKEILDTERITGGINETKLTNILSKNNSFDFHEYAQKYFKIFKEQYNPDTLRGYKSDLEKIREFAPILSIHDWNPEFVSKYHVFLKDIRGNSPNTCHKALKPIKKVLRYAREVDQIIKADPFVVYNIEKVATIPTYLEGDEINLLWEHTVPNNSKLPDTLRYTGLYFLLSCYTGLRYSDLAQITKTNIIQDGRVALTMVKGQDPLRLPLLSRAKQLIKIIGSKKIVTNQKGNEYLKILQQIVGITKPLHWHMGRHTMAMMLSDLGFDKEITAVLLGHKSLKSTAVYHRISKTRGIEEVARIQQKLDEMGHG